MWKNTMLFDEDNEDVEEYKPDSVPFTFPNLQELQLLMAGLAYDDLASLYGLFCHYTFPCLGKLFIELTELEL